MSLTGDYLFEIVNIGSSSLEPAFKAITIQGKGPALSKDPDDAESFDGAPLYGALGLTSRPYPKTDKGQAQGLLLRNSTVGNVVGIRDNRTNDVYGSLEPGDTAVYSVGPNKGARLVMKDATNTSVLMGKDSNGNDMIVSLDGQNNAISIQGFGCILQMDESGVVIGFKGNQLVINASGITVGGKNVILGSGVPTFAVVGGVPTAVGMPVLCSAPSQATVPPTKCSGSVYLTT